MNYYIVNKITCVNNDLVYTPIGYTTNEEERNSINTNYDNTLGSWIENNKSNLENGTISISVFFETTTFVYSAYEETTSIEGMNLQPIDINTL